MLEGLLQEKEYASDRDLLDTVFAELGNNTRITLFLTFAYLLDIEAALARCLQSRLWLALVTRLKQSPDFRIETVAVIPADTSCSAVGWYQLRTAVACVHGVPALSYDERIMGLSTIARHFLDGKPQWPASSTLPDCKFSLNSQCIDVDQIFKLKGLADNIVRLQMLASTTSPAAVVAYLSACRKTVRSVVLGDFSPFGLFLPNSKLSLPYVIDLKYLRMPADLTLKLLNAFDTPQLRAFEYESLPTGKLDFLATHALRAWLEVHDKLVRVTIHLKDDPSVWHGRSHILEHLKRHVLSLRVGFEMTYVGKLWAGQVTPISPDVACITSCMAIKLDPRLGDLSDHGSFEMFTRLRTLSVSMSRRNDDLAAFQRFLMGSELPCLEDLYVELRHPEYAKYLQSLAERIPSFPNLRRVSVGLLEAAEDEAAVYEREVRRLRTGGQEGEEDEERVEGDVKYFSKLALKQVCKELGIGIRLRCPIRGDHHGTMLNVHAARYRQHAYDRNHRLL